MKFTIRGKSLEILVTVKMRANTQVQQCFQIRSSEVSLILPFPPTPDVDSLWKSFSSPSRSSSMFHISMVPPESAALVFFAWTSTTCCQVASLSPWVGLGSVIQNKIKRRSLACLNPEPTFHPFGVRLACEVWSCQAYTSRRWPSWAH